MCVCVCALSCVQLFVTPWTVARQALSMGFPRKEYWSQLPLPSPRDLLNEGSKEGARSLGWEDPLEKGTAPTPVFWPGEFHGLQSMGSQRVGHD